MGKTTNSLPSWITNHCQFGNHGEPFLWTGSISDDVDIAIMKLINLASDDISMALEACEFIDSCVEDSNSRLDKHTKES